MDDPARSHDLIYVFLEEQKRLKKLGQPLGTFTGTVHGIISFVCFNAKILQRMNNTLSLFSYIENKGQLINWKLAGIFKMKIAKKHLTFEFELIIN
jgi:hypothetical protein